MGLILEQGQWAEMGGTATSDNLPTLSADLVSVQSFVPARGPGQPPRHRYSMLISNEADGTGDVIGNATNPLIDGRGFAYDGTNVALEVTVEGELLVNGATLTVSGISAAQRTAITTSIGANADASVIDTFVIINGNHVAITAVGVNGADSDHTDLSIAVGQTAQVGEVLVVSYLDSANASIPFSDQDTIWTADVADLENFPLEAGDSVEVYANASDTPIPAEIISYDRSAGEVQFTVLDRSTTVTHTLNTNVNYTGTAGKNAALPFALGDTTVVVNLPSSVARDDHNPSEPFTDWEVQDGGRRVIVSESQLQAGPVTIGSTTISAGTYVDATINFTGTGHTINFNFNDAGSALQFRNSLYPGGGGTYNRYHVGNYEASFRLQHIRFEQELPLHAYDAGGGSSALPTVLPDNVWVSPGEGVRYLILE